jgi:hypothetical protein
MAKQRIFISFDYDYDNDIKILLAGQAKLEDSPFDFTDASVKEHLTGDWKEKVKRRLKNCDQAIILCGEHTSNAAGINAELEIMQDLDLPYFLLSGRKEKSVKPNKAYSEDKIYKWEWQNLKNLIDGQR